MCREYFYSSIILVTSKSIILIVDFYIISFISQRNKQTFRLLTSSGRAITRQDHNNFPINAPLQGAQYSQERLFSSCDLNILISVSRLVGSFRIFFIVLSGSTLCQCDVCCVSHRIWKILVALVSVLISIFEKEKY